MADSFTRRLKADLARVQPRRAGPRQALLAGLFRPGALVPEGSDGAILITSFDHPAVARLAVHLLRQEGVPRPELLRRIDRRHGRFALHLADLPATGGWLGTLGVDLERRELPRDLAATAARRQALVRGYFLATASVNDPHKPPHLEFALAHVDLATEVAQALEQLEIRCHLTERRGSWLVYLKSRQEITSLLAVIGARGALFAFEDVWALRELRDRVNRQVNAETANVARVARAASRQLLAISTLEAAGRLEHFSPVVRQAAAARLADPQATLAQLGIRLGISKPAAAARLARLVRAAGLERWGENR